MFLFFSSFSQAVFGHLQIKGVVYDMVTNFLIALFSTANQVF